MVNFCDLFDTHSEPVINQTKPTYSPCAGEEPTLFSFLLIGIATFIICISGLLGNCLSALVLLRSQFKSSVNFLLLGLTFSDTIVILYHLATFTFPQFLGYFGVGKTYSHYIFPICAPYMFPVASIGQTGSVYFTVAVTIERYVVVCWPLYARSWCTNKRARTYTIIVLIFSVLLTLPKWFELQSKEPTNRIPCHTIETTKFRNNPTYMFLYVNLTYFLFMYAFPFLILVTLNMSIYKRIKRANRRRESLTVTTARKESRENSISQMLLCVVVVFLACNFLPMINNALESWCGHQRSFLIDISNFLLVFNSCCNFGIYYIFGQKFRTCFITTWNEIFPCLTINYHERNPSTTWRSVRTEATELQQLNNINVALTR